MRNTKKRGISPVIATVILVAIAIVISIAAAFWMTGLLSSFTMVHPLRLQSITIVLLRGTTPCHVHSVLERGATFKLAVLLQATSNLVLP